MPRTLGLPTAVSVRLVHNCAPGRMIQYAVAVVITARGALVLLGGSLAPLLVFGSLTAVALALVMAAWMAGGRPFLKGTALLRAPLYVLWKLPVYTRFLRKPEARWNRTPRRP